MYTVCRHFAYTKKNVNPILRYRGKRSNRLPHFFCKGKDRCRASRFLPLFFRLQIDLLELVKGNIKLNLYLVVPFDTDSFHKLRYNHFLGLKVTVVEQLGPVHQFSVKQDAQEIQNELQGIIESFDNFSYTVILLRLFYPRITSQAIKKHYSEMLLSQFLQLETGAVYDFTLSGWLTPTPETLKVFLNNILEMHRNKVNDFQSSPDPIERGLECAYILFISDILADISPLKEMAPERPHLQFLLAPETFDYSQVDFTNYMWVNFARKKGYMPYFVAHKDVIAPKIKERIEKNLASKDEKKILYRFLVDDNEIWKI